MKDGDAARADAIAAGRTALANARWNDARASFEAALLHGDAADALEGLGAACAWLEDIDATFAARNHAYRLYRDAEDRCGAARVAVALAWDHFLAGERAVANGWVGRAHRLLAGLPSSSESGWLAIFEAHVALLVDHDAAETERLAASAADLGQSLADVDLQVLALAYQGLAEVSQGRIRDGMRLLDESTAAAVAGEVSDPDSAASACCCLIYACERVRDYDRAAQWCVRVKELSKRWSYHLMFSVCQAHYAGVLMWRGAWREAESELREAMGHFERTRPAEAAEALVKLAELRCLQGRLGEADALLAKAETAPYSMLATIPTLLARGNLALERGRAVDATDHAECYLRAVSSTGRMERVAGLELLVRAKLASDEPAGVCAAVDEISKIAAEVGTDSLRAAACFVRGLASAANGDHEAAKECLQDAVARYESSGAAYHAARARLELARCLIMLGRNGSAAQYAGAARDRFRRLGAATDAERATAVLDSVAVPGPYRRAADPMGLTARELDVLRLVAQGSTNQEIAERLVLSVRTVERHLSNVYEKLGIAGKAARAAAATYAANQRLV